MSAHRAKDAALYSAGQALREALTFARYIAGKKTCGCGSPFCDQCLATQLAAGMELAIRRVEEAQDFGRRKAIPRYRKTKA